jgi:hypothetical protein
VLVDAVGIAGAGMIIGGTWLIYRPASLVVAGAMLLGLAFRLAWIGARLDRPSART